MYRKFNLESVQDFYDLLRVFCTRVSIVLRSTRVEWRRRTDSGPVEQKQLLIDVDFVPSLPRRRHIHYCSTLTMTTISILWELPEVLLYQIVSFVAGPTHRAHVVCHQLIPLCKSAHYTLSLETNTIWDAILTSDYGVMDDTHSRKRKRVSQRLKQSHLQRVRDAHLMIKDNTEIAYFYLTEMCVASSKKSCLSKARLASLIDEYGPHLRLDHLVSSGGSFLVEVCRARHVKEAAILKCVEALLEHQNVNVNLVTNEPGHITALCVAAARGMATVVKYLLKKGADQGIQCTGRFRLYTQSRRTVKCTNATPIEFAEKIRSEEKAEGASENDLKDLTKTIQYLVAACPAQSQRSIPGSQTLDELPPHKLA
jgi:hypothetical protein